LASFQLHASLQQIEDVSGSLGNIRISSETLKIMVNEASTIVARKFNKNSEKN
jgi:hypothetical protein